MYWPVLDALSCYENNPLDWLTCGLDDLAVAVGGSSIWGLIVGGMTMLVFYVVSNGRLATASTLTVLIGGFMLPILPQQHQTTAGVVMFLGLVGAVFALLIKVTQ